ncbi:LCP family protein [Mesobacillus harenae]|uniref:LCP family protein n=1 Tax=Mesobacillus harenae TaxID=2213203 RepID=UPI0015809590|nr:LCP family protein [Mesobacillus harenae]
MRSDRYKPKHKKSGKSKKILYFLLFIAVLAIIYSIYQYRQGVSDSTQTSEIDQEKYEFNGNRDESGATNILLLGSDARGDEQARADTIMIAHYNPDTGSYKVTSIMRDTYVDIPGHGKNKINAANAIGGPELLRQTIKENFDVDMQYYAIIDFEGFVRVIDEAFPQGVEVNVEKHMSENIGVTLQPGLQKLDGEHLLGYVRFRQDAVGDFGRVERQQNVIKEVAGQLASIQTIPKLPKLLGVITPFVNTNLDTGDMLFMGRGLLTANEKTIETLRIPVEGTFQNQRVSGAGAVLVIDIEANRQALKTFIAS